MSSIDDATADSNLTGRELLLDAAESLFYERGYQSVGMDEVRAASGLPLKRIYALFPGKEALAVAMLDRRDRRWHVSLAEHVDHYRSPSQRVLAIFDWLSDWLAGPGHRGCAWINAHGELGGTSEAIQGAAQRHKDRFRAYVTELATEAEAPRSIADAIFLLAEGSMVTAGISGSPEAAGQARRAAQLLLQHGATG